MLGRFGTSLVFALILSSVVKGDELGTVLSNAQKQGRKVSCVAFAPSGGFSVIFDQKEFYNHNIPDELHKVMANYRAQNFPIKCVAFTPNGGWSILFGFDGFYNRGVPNEAHQAMLNIVNLGKELKWIAYSPDGGWSLFYDKRGYANREIPPAANTTIGNVAKRYDLTSISFTGADGYCLIAHGGRTFAAHGIPDTVRQSMLRHTRTGRVRQLAFSPTGASCLLHARGTEYRANTVTPQQLPGKITELMKTTSVPGASIAVVNQGRIIWARGFGKTRTAATTNDVTPTTQFQAASVSKSVAALAALRLVDQKRMSLDKPCNESLRTWKIPTNQFSGRRQITLRHLLSHSSGLNVSGFSGYPRDEALPNLHQVLAGQAPANSPAIVPSSAPGTYQYSGGGTCVVQLMIEETEQKDFADAIDALVFQPLGLKNSDYDSSQENGRAQGHLENGSVVRGGWHIHPELAAAGLWTTPSDLAETIMAIQQSYAGRTGALLRRSTASKMLTSQSGTPAGLGVFPTRTRGFKHSGVNRGYRAGYVADRAGKAIVIMTNSDNGDSFISKVTALISTVYDLGL